MLCVWWLLYVKRRFGCDVCGGSFMQRGLSVVCVLDVLCKEV